MSVGVEGASRRAVAVIRGEALAISVIARLRAGAAAPGALADAWSSLRSDRHALQGFGKAIEQALTRPDSTPVR